ncbi:hypothetical protein [Agrobacterium rosae]|uniref:hypothetical protein n=1 Tax=Agrobacterium rosae TaxID=1972867 RepID=UPI003B9E383D
MAPKDYKHTPDRIEKIRQSKLGVKQTPETVAARFAYRETSFRVNEADIVRVKTALEAAERTIAEAISFFEAKLDEHGKHR